MPQPSEKALAFEASTPSASAVVTTAAVRERIELDLILDGGERAHHAMRAQEFAAGATSAARSTAPFGRVRKLV